MKSRFAGHSDWLPISFHQLALVIAIVVVVVLTNWLDSNHSYWYRRQENLTDIARETAKLGIFSLGAAIVIISGGIDLSAGSMIAFSGTVCASLMVIMDPDAITMPRPWRSARSCWRFLAR